MVVRMWKSLSRVISMVSHRFPILMGIRRDNLNITPKKICFTLHASIWICPENTVILVRFLCCVLSVVHRKTCYLLISYRSRVAFKNSYSKDKRACLLFLFARRSGYNVAQYVDLDFLSFHPRGNKYGKNNLEFYVKRWCPFFFIRYTSSMKTGGPKARGGGVER